MKRQNPRTPIALDLFCGAGGLSLGLAKAGIQVLCAVDSWERAYETYKLNFTHPIQKASVADLGLRHFRKTFGLERGELDLLAGGPPCQGFSIQRIGDDHDDRNSLVLEFARLVDELRPRMFMMENVPGLLGQRGEGLVAELDARFRAAGYETRASVVNAAEYGVPQVRRRVLWFGWRAEDVPFVLPRPTHHEGEFVTVMDAIADLAPPPAHDDPNFTDPLHRQSRLAPQNLERLKHIPPGGGMEDLPVRLRVKCHKQGAAKIGHRYVYGRLAPDQPASTIIAKFDSFTRGRFAHPYEHRNITLREGARLQSFPDNFRFVGSREDIAALIGNAVPPRLAEVVGRAIRRHLTKGQPHQRPRQLALFA